MRYMESMQKTIRRYNVHHWVDLFLGRLEQIKEYQKEIALKVIDERIQKEIILKYSEAKSRILFLDYDGTLAVVAAARHLLALTRVAG